MRKATHIKDYDYVVDVLQYAMNEDIKPSLRFTEIVGEFKNSRYAAIQQHKKEEELQKFNAFYGVFRKWKTQMNLLGLSGDEIKKLLHVHPWKQLKEAEGEGIEPVKNIYTRRIWKKQMVVKKLNPKCIDAIHKQKEKISEKENDAMDNTEQIDSK